MEQQWTKQYLIYPINQSSLIRTPTFTHIIVQNVWSNHHKINHETSNTQQQLSTVLYQKYVYRKIILPISWPASTFCSQVIANVPSTVSSHTQSTALEALVKHPTSRYSKASLWVHTFKGKKMNENKIEVNSSSPLIFADAVDPGQRWFEFWLNLQLPRIIKLRRQGSKEPLL